MDALNLSAALLMLAVAAAMGGLAKGLRHVLVALSRREHDPAQPMHTHEMRHLRCAHDACSLIVAVAGITVVCLLVLTSLVGVVAFHSDRSGDLWSVLSGMGNSLNITLTVILFGLVCLNFKLEAAVERLLLRLPSEPSAPPSHASHANPASPIQPVLSAPPTLCGPTTSAGARTV